MAYRVHCDGCDLEREYTDWVTASGDARDHEADHPDHWVRILET